MTTVSLRSRASQRGTTLIIGMIMLVLMTLLAVTSFTLGRGELQIITNMQFQAEASSAAQRALEQVISDVNFPSHASNVFATPCSGANTVCYDTNGDGTNDVTVTIRSRSDSAKPVCVAARMIPNHSLNLSNTNDLGCASGVTQTFGVAGATTGFSLCADSVWDVQAVAQDNITQARATATEGVSVRVAAASINNECP